MHKDRIKIAVALGYYARAAADIKTLADAIAAYALDEYRNDIDCQVGFRKGYQEAGKHFAAEGPEGHEFRELVGWIARLDQQVQEQRQDILEYLKRQEALTRHQAVYGGAAPGLRAEPGGGGGNGQDRMIAIDPDGVGGCVITEIGGGGPAYYLRRTDTGQLHSQNGKPVVYPSIPAAQKARDDLYVRMGIHCEPDVARPVDIGINQRQNSPRVDINQRAREVRRYIANLPPE